MDSTAKQEYVEFVTHHADRLCRTAYLLCGDWRRAEDATQEALIRLYRVWARLQRKGGIPSYARKVVVSTTLDGLRRRSSTEVVGGDSYFAGEQDPANPQSSPGPAASPPQEPYAVRTICEPAQAPPEHPEVDNAGRWPQVIVSDQDPDGTVSVRRSADGRDLAFCATVGYVSGPNQYFGSLGTYRPGKLTAAEKIHRFNAPGCGTPEQINCNGTTYSFAGKLPSGVTRVTAELGGNRTEGVVRDGYYAFRLFMSRPNVDIKEVPIKMRLFESTGRLVRELSIGPA